MGTTITAVIIHLCVFTANGENFAAIPLDDAIKLAEAAKEAIILVPSTRGVMVLVKPITDGCEPYDGKTIPGPR